MKQKSLFVIGYLFFCVCQTTIVFSQNHNGIIGIKQESDSLFRFGMKLYSDSLYEEAIPYFLKSDSLENVARTDNSAYHVDYGKMWAASCYYKIGQEKHAQMMSNNYIHEPINKFLLVKSDSILVIADRLEKDGNLEKALSKYYEASQIERTVLGENSYWYANTLRYCAYLSAKLGKDDDANKYKELSSFDNTNFDNDAFQRLQSMIVIDKNYEAVDSILNWYESKPQENNSSYAIHFLRFINGLNKVQAYQDVSLIAPYANSGKKFFKHLVSETDSSNAGTANYWPFLASCAETFNYLNDSTINEVAKFSFQYYSEWNQRDLHSLFRVIHNSYQYYCYNKLWASAAENMECFYDFAIEANDTTFLTPASATFIGSAFLRANNYKNAEKWFSVSYNLFQTIATRNKVRAYSELLLDMATLHHNQGNNTLALQYSTESCDVNLSNYGKNSKEYVDALALLADCEIGLGRQDDGLKHFEEVVSLLENTNNMSIREKQNYKDKLELLYLRLNKKKDITSSGSIVTENSIIVEASNAFAQGNLQEAISKFSYLLKIYDDNFAAVNLSNYVFVAGSLSNALVKNGNYVEADSIISKSITIVKEKAPDTHLLKGLYESKGLLYYTIKNMEMALHWYNLSKDLYEESETKGIRYASLISNISVCQMEEGNISEAKHLAEKAYDICTSFYGENSSDAADRLTVLNNLAVIYMKLKEIPKAKETLNSIISIASTPQTESIKALALANMGELLWNYEQDFVAAKEVLSQVQVLEAPLYIKDMAEIDLLLIRCITKDDDVLSEIMQYNDRARGEVSSLFSHFSEAERETYWEQKSSVMLFLNNISMSFFGNPEARKMAYDNALFTKNLLLNSGRFLENIARQGDSKMMDEIESIHVLKKSLSAKDLPKDSIESIIYNISSLEKRIIEMTPDFNKRLKSQFKSFEEVKSMLSNDDVAIEFILLPHVSTPIEESELEYAALIVKHDSEAPYLIPLCNKKQLDELFDIARLLNHEFVDSLYSINDNTLYKLLWSKIDSYLSNIKNVYYSPTGYINKINLSSISDGTQYISGKYNIHEVSSTTVIEGVKNRKEHNCLNATIFGDINYFEEPGAMSANSQKYDSFSSGDMFANRSGNRNSWDLLPGTKDEISYIDEIAKKHGIKSHVYSQNDASEESFKAMSGNAPDIIHVATHGFYFSTVEDVSSSFFDFKNSYTKKDFSLFFSGLLFAGANNVWTGKEIENNVEDGILTADEISRMDLNGCKLIVLSACDTGLGDIDNIDGVFGLQRGLKKAGASTILMSLWKVPDTETCLLMKSFYDHYLSGESAQQSLRKAQGELIKMGKSPYYWAGFILLD